MKLLIVEIKDCHGCPFHIMNYGGRSCEHPDGCYISKHLVKKFPPQCPLPDVDQVDQITKKKQYHKNTKFPKNFADWCDEKPSKMLIYEVADCEECPYRGWYSHVDRLRHCKHEICPLINVDPDPESIPEPDKKLTIFGRCQKLRKAILELITDLKFWFGWYFA